MKFDQEFVDSFESPFEFALYINMYYAGSRMLEFVGQRVLHTFMYEKIKDLTTFKEVNTVGSFKCQYIRNITNINFDVNNEIAILISCKNEPDYLQIMPVDIIQEAANLNNVPVKMINVNFLGRVCNHCGANTNLKSCSKCRIIKYCSKECQCADWKHHKKNCICGPSAAAAPAAAP